MSRHDDDFRIVPERERKLTTIIAQVMEGAYGLSVPRRGRQTGAKREPTFRSNHAIHQFFDVMSREGDDGYVAAALVFAATMEACQAGRGVRSHFLTELARAVHMASNEPHRTPRESEVVHMGKFVNVLIGKYPEMHVEWMEDMNLGDESHSIERQPTTVIRGVLLSPYIDGRQTVRFWGLSIASEPFPVRVFSDPCVPGDGQLFSPYQLRRFAAIYSVMPEAAVVRYAVHMRDNAMTGLFLRWDATARKGVIDERVIEPHARKRLLDGIVGHIADGNRRQFVANIFDAQPSAA